MISPGMTTAIEKAQIQILVIMQPESLINFQTVPSLENAEGNKKLMEKWLLIHRQSKKG